MHDPLYDRAAELTTDDGQEGFPLSSWWLRSPSVLGQESDSWAEFQYRLKTAMVRPLRPLLDDSTLSSFFASLQLRVMRCGATPPASARVDADADMQVDALADAVAHYGPREPAIDWSVVWLPPELWLRVSGELLLSWPASVLVLAAACQATLSAVHEHTLLARRQLVLSAVGRRMCPCASEIEGLARVWRSHDRPGDGTLRLPAVRLALSDAFGRAFESARIRAASGRVGPPNADQELAVDELEAALRATSPLCDWELQDIDFSEFAHLASRCIVARYYRHHVAGLSVSVEAGRPAALRRALTTQAGLRAAEVDGLVAELHRGYAQDAEIRGYAHGGGEHGEVTLSTHDYTQILLSVAITQ